MTPSENTNGAGEGEERQGPVIRDNRRIDPETGEVRNPEAEGDDTEEIPEVAEEEVVEADLEDDAPEVPDTPESVVSEAINADERVVELTNDLKRVQAEYANYRKRVDRDRVTVREMATAQVVGELLPILDDVGRAREHDELNGGFKAVGEALEATVAKLGLERYAEKGDEFDPNLHEALTLVPVPGISTQTVIEVFQPGYRMGERILRPARVVVGEPAEEDAEASAESSGSTAGSGGDTSEPSGAAGTDADGEDDK
ncbi:MULTISPECIES: nucleotide exchange factor GrpE [Nocardiopsis]|uniref:Protein GrpE n=1 Tax=Nocardiopsis sinuspersici TaxID=501010 RepID=A0A1V3C523_9ACTN|nr:MULTISPECIES: nucleotide exchange factor GrpE [Nocardiopsis]NYH52384.1 molecular chaperone GrpE [Nocardiopsis sinuspersici]OOC55877.1 nucleotide exchange factor GrpE [Nocardiopsis sinuspersici]